LVPRSENNAIQNRENENESEAKDKSKEVGLGIYRKKKPFIYPKDKGN
jgi:hypothetical protein